MFRAILCDDNEIILEGLSRQIGWKSLGIELAGVATDGNEAWELIQREPPDILITDIRMPYLDGLELSKRTKELNPNVVILIISAYDDFEYARTAVHLGVLDYILKPIELEAINHMLETAVSHCRRFYHDRHMMVTELLKSAAAGELSSHALKERRRELDFNREGYFCILWVKLNPQSIAGLSNEIRYSVERRFTTLSESLKNSGCYLLESSGDHYQVCLAAATKAELSQKRRQTVEVIRAQFPHEGEHFDVAIACGKPCEGLEAIYKSRQSCMDALKLYFVKGSNSDIFYEEVESFLHSPKPGGPGLPQSETRLMAYIKEQDKNGIRRELEQLKQWLYEKGSESYLYMTFSVGTFYTNLVRELEEAGVSLQDAFDSPIDEFKKIIASGTLESSIENLRESLFKICDSMRINKSRYGRLIDQALLYIQSHYASSSFSIDQVADAVCLSTSYFSTVFKSETGTTFTDYLIRIRMEKARALLEHTNLKMYEVSSQVGYENAAYFSAAFKRYYGKSPSELQKQPR